MPIGEGYLPNGTVIYVWPAATISMPCLEHIWGTWAGCPNADYVLNGPQTAAWQNSNLESVTEDNFAILNGIRNYYAEDHKNTTYAEAAAACLGINRYQAAGDEPTGADAESLEPEPFAMQCPPGTFINKVRKSRAMRCIGLRHAAITQR